MKIELLQRLRCPRTGESLTLQSAAPSEPSEGEVGSGWLLAGDSKYEIRRGIPRFVPASNYADNFGMQWNFFSRTQLDSHSGHPISAQRFWSATSWTPEELKGRWVLDVGCGSGRFAEVALHAGANVVALDYSSAVDACLDNLRGHPNLHVVQGDVYGLPFQPGCFDFVYSLGVLQHTPHVERAFAELPRMIAPGGRLCVDYYPKTLKSLLLPKYWLRPVSKRVPKPVLFKTLQATVPSMLRVSRALGKTPLIGGLLKRAVPVANYEGILPLSEEQLREWALLDTFDWLSPEYDQPQTARTAMKWLQQSGLENVQVVRLHHLVARGTKPLAHV